MIDEHLDREVEELLRATLAEMIPAAHTAARPTVPTRDAATTDGPWVVSATDAPRSMRSRPLRLGVAAAAIIVLCVGGLAVIGEHRRDQPAQPSGVGAAPSSDEPTWYPLLRDALPERFRHVALTQVTDQQAFFVAISPDDGKALEIQLATGGYSTRSPTDVDVDVEWVQLPQGWSVRTPAGLFVSVTCDIGVRGRDFAGPPNYCDMTSAGELTSADIRSVVTKLAQSAPADSIGPALGAPVPAALDEATVTAMIAALDPARALIGDTTWAADRILDYAPSSTRPETSVRLVSGVYPPATKPRWDYSLYEDAAAFWRFTSDGRALRISTIDTAVEALDALDAVATAIIGPSTVDAGTDPPNPAPTPVMSGPPASNDPGAVGCADVDADVGERARGAASTSSAATTSSPPTGGQGSPPRAVNC